MDGTVTITAIMEPFKMIFFIESLPVLLSLDNNEFSKNGNKNQRLVRKYWPNFVLYYQKSCFHFLNPKIMSKTILNYFRILACNSFFRICTHVPCSNIICFFYCNNSHVLHNFNMFSIIRAV